MDGWVKYACLTKAINLFIDCNAANNSRHNDSDTPLIDILKTPVIESEIAFNYTFSSTDPNSIAHTRQIATMSTRLTLNKKLETDLFDPEKVKFFKFEGLPHAEIQDLKIAVDDKRIINYLNPDF